MWCHTCKTSTNCHVSSSCHFTGHQQSENQQYTHAYIDTVWFQTAVHLNEFFIHTGAHASRVHHCIGENTTAILKACVNDSRCVAVEWDVDYNEFWMHYARGPLEAFYRVTQFEIVIRYDPASCTSHNHSFRYVFNLNEHTVGQFQALWGRRLQLPPASAPINTGRTRIRPTSHAIPDIVVAFSSR